MAPKFLQLVQSAMEGRFMTDPILTDEICWVEVNSQRIIAVSQLQVPSEVGMVATFLLTDYQGNPHRDRTIYPHKFNEQQIIYTMDEYDSILDYITSVAESVAA